VTYTTEQEAFWAGDYSRDFLERCSGDDRVDFMIGFLGKMLRSAHGIRSAVELGCGIGLNLRALKAIDPDIELGGYDIYEPAIAKARALGIADVHVQSIIEPINAGRTYDLAFTKGTLIYVHPDRIADAYRNLCALSNRYVLVCEFYNPTVVTANYRGYDNQMFKRDFPGELIEGFGLRLVDYSFEYSRIHPYYADFTWFLLEK
jgi:spore coat polysaccharide biosynthesis protein SpsF